MEDLKIFDENGKALHIADVICRCFVNVAELANADKEDIAIRVDYRDDKPHEIIIEDMLCNTLDTIAPNGI